MIKLVTFNDCRLQNLLEIPLVIGAHKLALMSIYCCLDESYSNLSVAPSFRNCLFRRRQFLGMTFVRLCRFEFRSCHIYEVRLFWSNSYHVSCSYWLFVHWEFAIFPRLDFSSAPFKLPFLFLSLLIHLVFNSEHCTP